MEQCATDLRFDPPGAHEQGPEVWVEQSFELLNADTAASHELALRALHAAELDSLIAGKAHHAVGMSAALLGQHKLAREHLRLAAKSVDHFGASVAACRAWRDYGSVLAFVVGDLHAGLAAMERALSICKKLGDECEEGVLLSRLGAMLAHAGRHDEARQQLERAVELLARDTTSEAYAGALSNLGHSCLLTEDYARAAALLSEERTLHDAKNARLRLANCETNLATALAGTGDGEGAQSCLETARELLDLTSDGHQWVDFLLASGRVALLRGAPQDAVEPLKEGLAAARAQELQRIEIELLTELAKAQEIIGDLRDALESERAMHSAERRWLDQQSSARLRALESDIELVRERAEREALEKAQAELEERVEARTAELQIQMRKREAAQEMARFWADHDWLTRLPNRRQLKAELTKMLSESANEGTQLGVLFIDLDGFKEINDSHGHLAGDHLLRATARRLQLEATPGAIVTRFGGDEFVVLLPRLSTPEEVVRTAQTLRSVVLKPMSIDGRSITPSCSIGVAVGPRDATSPEELLRRADQAMLEAKKTGRNRVLELDSSGQARLDRRSWIRRELKACIDDGRLTPVFQPIWDARSRRMTGVELLARLNDPEFGAVSPAEFIPLAEESGLIIRLGLWAVAQASAAARLLRDQAQGPVSEELRVSVNLSSAQLGSDTLVQDLVDAVANAGGQNHWLQLELTESRQLAEDAAVRQRLIDLRRLGFTLAIDDFGAGYSSFSYLSNDFFDRLKIDRGLIETAAQDARGSAVIGSIVAMAQHLGLDVVGEGVETQEQLELLSTQGCDVVQGYHIARAMPIEMLLEWMGPQ